MPPPVDVDELSRALDRAADLLTVIFKAYQDRNTLRRDARFRVASDQADTIIEDLRTAAREVRAYCVDLAGSLTRLDKDNVRLAVEVRAFRQAARALVDACEGTDGPGQREALGHLRALLAQGGPHDRTTNLAASGRP